MEITQVYIKNYRLLKEFTISLEEELSLVVGKNNTGKTSLLKVMNKFLNGNEKSFCFDDFNIDVKDQLVKLVLMETLPNKEEYEHQSILMDLLIKYSEDDSLANLSDFIINLDPDHYFVRLRFEYYLDYPSFLDLRMDFQQVRAKKKLEIKDDKAIEKLLGEYLSRKNDYFKISKKTIPCNKEGGAPLKEGFSSDLKNKSLDKVISFKYISARRDVTNKEIDKTLSSQIARMYDGRYRASNAKASTLAKKSIVGKSNDIEEGNDDINAFKESLADADIKLSAHYEKIFETVLGTVKKFGGLQSEESTISIRSSLEHRNLLSENTTVMYNFGGHSFPEHYNGLGYMNLISILFEIEIIKQEFKKEKEGEMADINFLFIEEPEAHTHPQMQYVFIKNIKTVLKNSLPNGRKLQYIITTHSSHIVAESNFDDIKYLKKVGLHSVEAKGLKELSIEYGSDNNKFKFLKQYLTLSKAELFFADKAILVEGATERILLPAMMKKTDQEENTYIPLLAQNISLVEVGAHAQVFEKFIAFLGVKTLVITDLDSACKVESEKGKTSWNACAVEAKSAEVSTNSALDFFLKTKNLQELISKKEEGKLFHKRGGEWVSDEKKGYLRVAYQLKEKGYHARSFEDAFIHLNRDFILNNSEHIDLTKKHLDKYREDRDAYTFATKAIKSKPTFAIEVLMASEEKEGKLFTNWQTPAYIKEGLIWLKND